MKIAVDSKEMEEELKYMVFLPKRKLKSLVNVKDYLFDNINGRKFVVLRKSLPHKNMELETIFP